MSIKDENEALSLTGDMAQMADEGTAPAPPAMTPGPQAVTVDGGLGRARFWFAFGQVMAAAGALIAFLGFADTSWVVRTFNWLHSTKAVPVISCALWLGGTVCLWWRAKGRQKTLAFLSALLPDQVARVRGALHPDVQASVAAAKATMPAGDPPVMESRR